MEKLRTLDLFSGIGGFSLGLDSTGYFETVAFCEIEEFPCKVLNKHWPNVPIYNDVRELSYEKLQADGLISRRRGIDVICGGYPCQPFSVAGRQKGEEDPRHLWPEYFRLVRELRPHYVIGENVGGHLRLGLDSVLEDLDSENYTVRCFSVEAASIGAPHRRERIFWIAENMADSYPGFSELTDEEIQAGWHSLNGSGSAPMADSVSDEHRFEIGESSGVSESLSRKHRQENSASREPIGTGAIRRTDNGHVSDAQFKGLEGRSRDNRGGGREVLSGIEHDGHSVRRQVRRTGGEDGGAAADDVSDTDSERRGGRDLSGRGAEQRELLKTEQEGRTLGREAERCGELPGQEGEGATTDVADAIGKQNNRKRKPNEPGRDPVGRHSETAQRKERETSADSFDRLSEDVADADDSRDRTPKRRTNGNREKTIEGWQEQSQFELSGHSSARNDADTHIEGLEVRGCERKDASTELQTSEREGDPRSQDDVDAESRDVQAGHCEQRVSSETESSGKTAWSSWRDSHEQEEERRKTTFESYLGGGNDGISAWLDGSWERGIPRVAPSNKMRVPRLKALGNAVLPQLVYMVGMTIVLSTKSSENEEESGG